MKRFILNWLQQRKERAQMKSFLDGFNYAMQALYLEKCDPDYLENMANGAFGFSDFDNGINKALYIYHENRGCNHK